MQSLQEFRPSSQHRGSCSRITSRVQCSKGKVKSESEEGEVCEVAKEIASLANQAVHNKESDDTGEDVQRKGCSQNAEHHW